MKFKCEDSRLYAEIEDSIVDRIKNVYDTNLFEAGGWLFGKYSKDHTTAIIESFIVLPNISKDPETNFEFGKTSKQILDEKWDEGQRILGNFHTHPNNSPEPSLIDGNQSMDFAANEKLNCPQFLLLIMGRDYSTTLHMYTTHDELRLVRDSS